MTSFALDDFHKEILEIEIEEIIEYFQKYEFLHVILTEIHKLKNDVLELSQHIHSFYDIYYQIYDVSNQLTQFYQSSHSQQDIIKLYDEYQIWFIQIKNDIDYIWKHMNYISPCTSEDEEDMKNE